MIFISYRSYDYAVAGQLRSILTKHGVKCWMAPESIPSGMDYGEWIPEAIDGCDAFVLILSRRTYDSKWVPKELNRAINCGKRIIPIHLDASKLPKAWAFKLENVQVISAHNRFDEACNELLGAIGGVPDKQRSVLDEDDEIVYDAELAEDEAVIYDEGLATAKKRKHRFSVDEFLFVFVLCLIVFIMLCVKTPAEWFEENKNWLTGVFGNVDGAAMTSTDVESTAQVTNNSDIGEISIKIGTPIEGKYLEIDWENEDARTNYFEYKVLNLIDQSVLSMGEKPVSIGFTTYTIRFAEGAITPGQYYRLWVGAYDENDEMIAQSQKEWCIDCFHAFESDGMCKKCGEACLHGRMKKVPLSEWYVKVNDTIHRSITKYGLECTYCGFMIGANAETVESNALHQFDSNGVCFLCGTSSDD